MDALQREIERLQARINELSDSMWKIPDGENKDQLLLNLDDLKAVLERTKKMLESMTVH